MLSVALLMTLGSVPALGSTILLGDSPRTIRLVDLEEPLPESYEGWSRPRLRAEYDRLEDARPGLFLPVTMVLVGITGTGITSVALISGLTSFFGIPVLITAVLAVSMVISLGLVAVGAILLVRLMPERNLMGRQMDAIEHAHRESFRRPQYQPCPQVPEQPSGPPPIVPPPPSYQPSTELLRSENLVTVAVF